jgi:pSer/pThr/pTyr-binding forkhead associated (FHA) protein
MALKIFAELVPLGGGDPIPLTQTVVNIGRKPSNDICLDFANVSGQHCVFTYKGGVWYVRDMKSQNGTKVNGERILDRMVRPGDKISIAKHEFTMKYEMTEDAVEMIQTTSEPAPDDPASMNKSLLEKAGLTRSKSD